MKHKSAFFTIALPTPLRLSSELLTHKIEVATVDLWRNKVYWARGMGRQGSGVKLAPYESLPSIHPPF